MESSNIQKFMKPHDYLPVIDHDFADDDNSSINIDHAHAHVNSFEIFIQPENSPGFPLNASPTDLISSIKTQIYSLHISFPVEQQRLFSRGNLLQDNFTLGDYSISGNDHINLMMAIQVYLEIKESNGEIFRINVESSETIEDAKEKIREMKGYSIYQQILVFKEIELEDNRTISYYNLSNGDNIELAFNKSTSCVMQIYVKIPEEETLTLDVKQSDSIESIKVKIEVEVGISKEDQILFYGSQVLHNKMKLADLNIHKDSVLYLGNQTPVEFTEKEKPFTIFIRFQGNKQSLSLEVFPSSKVVSVKEQIQKKTSIPVERQILQYFRKDLEDFHSLADYSIKKNGTLLLITDYFESEMTVILANNQKLSITCHPRETVLEFKKKVTDQTGIGTDKQIIYWRKTKLEDEQVFEFYKIFEEDYFQLELYIEQRLSIIMEDGEKLEVLINESETVRKLKEIIQQKKSIAVGNQKIKHGDLILKDSKAICFYQLGYTPELTITNANLREIKVPCYNRIISVLYEEEDTIEDIKYKIQQLENIPMAEQVLIIDNTEYPNDYKITENYLDSLKLVKIEVIPSQPADYSIKVYYEGKSYRFSIPGTNTISDLKNFLHIWGIYDVVLITEGQIQQDYNAIKDCVSKKFADFLAIRLSKGGKYLNFLQTFINARQISTQDLKSSLHFLEDQQTLNECFEVIQSQLCSIQKAIPGKHEEESLVAIALLTSNLIYDTLNNALSNNQSLAQWETYLGYLISGLKEMPFYGGRAFKAVHCYRIAAEYHQGSVICWRDFSTWSENEKTDLSGDDTLFEAELVSAKNTSAVSIFSQDENIILLPFTYFEVVKISDMEDNKPVRIQLRELPTPRNPRVIFWVDDNPHFNYDIALQFEKHNFSCVFCTSTKDAINVINKYHWLLYLDKSDFLVITDMARDEDGIINPRAGIDLLNELVITYSYRLKAIIFCKNKGNAEEKCKQLTTQGLDCRVVTKYKELADLIII